MIHAPGPALATPLSAADLSPLLNAYSIQPGPPRSIVVRGATQLAALGEVTVSGRLLKKQLVALDPATGARAVTLAAQGGAYVANSEDGDLHFCLGTAAGIPHIACELQNAKPWIAEFNAEVLEDIVVTGFFRCMFEHAGFRSNDDAHVFEIHPVRAVTFPAKVQAFDVGIPARKSLHTWGPRLSQQDAAVSVRYDPARDTLTFTGMADGDTNYVHALKGRVSGLSLAATSPAPASFMFDCAQIGHPVQVFCLKGSAAYLQLARLRKTNITLTALRNIDLTQALKNRYLVNLLAIAIA